MKAAFISTFGGAENIQYGEQTLAINDADSVTVRVKASALNPLDSKIMAGYMEQVFPVQMPYIVGSDFSGIVEEVGSNVSQFRPGERVAGRTDPCAGGALAEFVVINPHELISLPDEMSFEQAAAIPTAYGTAHLALFGKRKLQAGQRVLIHAGAGGVGSFAIQLAKQAGAEVIATASAKNIAMVASLGADEVIDYRSQNITQIAPVDVVLDPFGGAALERSWQMLKPGGYIATLADFTITDRGDRHGHAVFFADATVALPQAMRDFSNGNLQIVIDSIHLLEQSRAALDRVASGHACGKVIVRSGR